MATTIKMNGMLESTTEMDGDDFRGRAIERLRASKVAHNSELRQRGHDAGNLWAQDSAETEELETLAHLYESRSPGREDRWMEESDGFRGRIDWAQLVCLIGGGRYEHMDDQTVIEGGERFWSGIDEGDHTETAKKYPAFLYGFVDGALAIWNDVKDEVNNRD